MDWYGHNKPGKGVWKVDGAVVDPGVINTPTYLVQPRHDYITPPASALALQTRMPDIQTFMPDTGHIGMMASATAAEKTWRNIARFMRDGDGI